MFIWLSSTLANSMKHKRLKNPEIWQDNRPKERVHPWPTALNTFCQGYYWHYAPLLEDNGFLFRQVLTINYFLSHSLGLTIAYISKSGINLTFSLSGNFFSQVIERKSIMKKRSFGNCTGRNRCSIQVLWSLKWRRAILNTMDKTRWYWNENLMIFQFIELQGWNFLFDCKLLRESDLLASN